MNNSRRRRKSKHESVFAKNLACLMEERGITQRALAEMAGVRVSVIHGWVTGASPSDYGAVLKLAKGLNLDFQFLLTGESVLNTGALALSDLFHVETDPNLSGIYQIEAKKLVQRALGV